MSHTSLTLFKQHVRADDFADDDAYLQQCLDAAEQQVVTATNRTLDELLALGPTGKACRHHSHRPCCSWAARSTTTAKTMHHSSTPKYPGERQPSSSNTDDYACRTNDH